jgi:hypothetical protein
VGAPPKETVGAPEQMTVSQHSKSEGWHPSPLSPPPIHTDKTPDVEFRTYDRMPQDQTVHRAEYVSGLWAAKIQLNIRSFPLFSELSEDFPEVSEGFSGGN